MKKLSLGLNDDDDPEFGTRSRSTGTEEREDLLSRNSVASVAKSTRPPRKTNESTEDSVSSFTSETNEDTIKKRQEEVQAIIKS